MDLGLKANGVGRWGVVVVGVGGKIYGCDSVAKE